MKLKIRSLIFYIFYYPFYKMSFGGLGKRSRIFSPLKLQGRQCIFLGDRVTIEYKTWLAALPLTGDNCVLEIQEGTAIGHFNHIYATQKIVIGKNVLTADKVYISDNLHEYHNIDIPILQQPIKQIKPVFIGDGTWIGENACIIGASIGKQCVIGANSVVTKDVPDYCVAVGVPAKIIKRYNFKEKQWLNTHADGGFIE